MKKIILIPTLIFPFLILFILISLFISSSVPAFNEMWENLFSNNVYVALGMILILFVLIMIINVIYLIVGMKNKYDVKELAKSLMIIKLIQIPAYIGIFIIGALCLLTIFTLPIVLFLFFLDCLCVILTGVLLLLVIVRSKQEEADRKSVV